MNPNDTEIKTADAIETISILYPREAQRVIQIYTAHKPEGTPKDTTEGSSPQQPEANAQQAASPQEDPIAMIEKLASLKEKGIISEEEFSQKKQELLAKL
jgi:hypothetical protein